jgi:hypothetical protein
MNPQLEPPSLNEPAPGSSSLAGRLANVFVAPGEVFEELKTSPPRAANWLVPVLLACLVGVVYCVTIFSTESLAQQMHEMRVKALQQKIDAGKMPREQGQQAIEALDRFMTPTLMSILGSFSAAVISFAALFVSALIVWLIGKLAFKAEFTYLKAMEVCGLASMIGVLGVVVQTLLVLGFGKLTVSPGPALLIQDFDPKNLWHQMASMLSLITFWQVGVGAAGLAKLGGISWAKAAGWLYGLWAAVVLGYGLVIWAVSHL